MIMLCTVYDVQLFSGDFKQGFSGHWKDVRARPETCNEPSQSIIAI